MLKANVGLSRKLSENYQSTGFSLNLEGEINATLDDPEAVIERVRELYDLADEALRTADRGPPVRLGHRLPGRRPSARQQRPFQPSSRPRGQRPALPQRPSGREAPEWRARHQQAGAVPPDPGQAAEIVRAEAGRVHRGDHRPTLHPLRPDQEGGRGRHRGPQPRRLREQPIPTLNPRDDFNFPAPGMGDDLIPDLLWRVHESRSHEAALVVFLGEPVLEMSSPVLLREGGEVAPEGRDRRPSPRLGRPFGPGNLSPEAPVGRGRHGGIHPPSVPRRLGWPGRGRPGRHPGQ